MKNITTKIGFYLILLISHSSYGQTQTYTYDALGRLKLVTDNINGDRNYAYDSAGNRTDVSVQSLSSSSARSSSSSRSSSSAATDTQPPSTPGNPAFSSVTNTTATATWTAATDNVAVTGYEYKVSSGSWMSVGIALTANLTGLTPNTSYTIYVRAKDAAGNYSTTPSSGPLTTANLDTTPPSPPGNPTFNSITNTSATVIWTAATDNIAVTGYEYRVGSSSWTSVGTALTANLTGLTQNTTYTIYVRAKDAAGNYSTTPSSGPLTTTNLDTAPPSSPGNPTFNSITNTSATVAWTAATDNIAVTGYEYRVGSGSWTSAGTALTANLTGLTQNTAYTIYVRAKDGASNYSTTPSSGQLTTTNLDTTPPSSPGIPFLIASTDQSLTVGWNAATDNAGVTGYEYHVIQGSWVQSWQSLTNVLNVNIMGLTDNTQYTVEVRAKDAQNNYSATPSSAVFKTLAAALPAPTGLKCQGPLSPYGGGYHCSWNAVSGATSYDGSFADGTNFSTKNTYIDSAGIYKAEWVRAVNASGQSPYVHF